MANNPELIAFSEYKLGGVQNFYHNILSNDPYNLFDKRWIFARNEDATDTPLLAQYNCCEEIVFSYSKKHETAYSVSKKLIKNISKQEGVILANFELELITLHLYRRHKKTIFHVCHDELYVPVATKFSFLIDVFIAHNIFFFEELKKQIPHRINDIYYLPYGVNIPECTKNKNLNNPLRIVFLARHHKAKGVYDIPQIDEILKERGITVQWSIIGDGPEKNNLEKLLIPRGNFSFYTLPNTTDVIEKLQKNDIFLLPSKLDGLPVALLEAMSVGCVPVISEFNAGIKNVVTEDVGFIVDVGDVKAFADKITFLNANRHSLEDYSTEARKKIVQEYDAKQRAKDYFNLFRNYKSLKKKTERKFPKYGGFLDYPIFPKRLVQLIRKLK